jgi:cyclic-di-GMP-binding biofilm dispersal mediator protein
VAAWRVVTRLEGRSIVVAGASGGLGAPITRLLAAHGARLTLVGRDRDRLEQVGVDASVVAADLRKVGVAERVVAAAVEAHGALDGVVFAAGVVAFGPALQTPDDVLVEVFTLNTLAPIRLLRAAAEPLQQAARDGRDPFFATLSAVVAEQPVAGMAGYAASKAAITAFDAAAGRELRRVGIRLLDLRPPHTETGLATRPVHGSAPRLPEGLSPDAVAHRIVAAIVDGERDLPAAAFTAG